MKLDAADGTQDSSSHLFQLKDDAVALIDVLAPTDFILNSPLAQADGQVSTLLTNLCKCAPTHASEEASETTER